MKPAFKDHDVVTALVALPAQGEDEAVRVGQVGTIVHIATGPSLAYLVEFINDEGETLAMPFMTPEQIAPWLPEPEPA